MRLSRQNRRPGITLLEVLGATAIFLMSIVAIGELMSGATDQALEVHQRSRATRLCQSKMNEFAAGVEQLGGSSSGTFDEEPDWNWSADIQNDGSAQNLYRVKLTVSRDTPSGPVEVTMTQFIFDPLQKGHLTGTTTASSASSSSPSGSTGSNQGNSGAMGNAGGMSGMSGMSGMAGMGGFSGMSGGGNRGAGGGTGVGGGNRGAGGGTGVGGGNRGAGGGTGVGGGNRGAGGGTGVGGGNRGAGGGIGGATGAGGALGAGGGALGAGGGAVGGGARGAR